MRPRRYRSPALHADCGIDTLVDSWAFWALGHTPVTWSRPVTRATVTIIKVVAKVSLARQTRSTSCRGDHAHRWRPREVDLLNPKLWLREQIAGSRPSIC